MTPPVQGAAEGLNAAVAAQIRAEAAAAKLSDKALAEKAGVPYSSLRRWLGKDAGNERHIDVSVLYALAGALELEPALIITRAQARMKPTNVSHLPVTPKPSDDATDLGAVASTEKVIEEPGENSI